MARTTQRTRPDADAENVTAALGRIETYATTGAAQLDKDHGVVAAEVARLRSALAERDEDLAELQEKYTADLAALKEKSERQITALAGQNRELSARLSMVASELTKPLQNS